MVMNANWRTARDHGKDEFSRGNYRQSLDDFSVAVTNCPASEKHILLSNIVACRLKLGEQDPNASMEQFELAVSDAQACVRANPRYSKGYVRLASAHMALGRSNDACQALQTAIALDPNNRMAKQMLVQELRRDHRQQQQQASYLSNTQTTQSSSAESPFIANSTSDHSTTNNNHRQTYVNLEDDDDNGVDEFVRNESLFTRLFLWYQSQNEDVRTFVWIVVGIFVLYVGFGGRFGFESNDTMQGHYGEGNIYERYREASKRGGGTTPHASRSNKDSSFYGETEEEPYSYSTHYYGNGGSSGDGMWYMLLTGVALYASQRLGISPWQMLFLVRMADRRRRFGGGGGGGGGFYYGGGPNFMRFGARPRRR
jgi:tetratricopeptide (TPR) repeat protein